VLTVGRFGERKLARLQVRRGSLLEPFRLEPVYELGQPVFVQRFDIRTGRLLSLARIPAVEPRFVVSPDGGQVAYTTEDRAGVGVADARTGRELWRQPTGSGYSRGSFTPDGRQLAWNQQQGARWRIASFDAATGKPGAPFAADRDSEASDSRFSPNGRWLLIGLPWSFEVWDTTTRARLEPDVGGSPLAFPTPNQLLVGSGNYVDLLLVDLPSGKLVRTWKDATSDVLSGGWVASPGDGKVFAVGHSWHIQIHDGAMGQPLPVSPRDIEFHSPVGFNHRGRLYVESSTLSIQYDRRRTVEWDPRTGHTKPWLWPPDENTTHPATPRRVGRDEEVLVTCDSDRTGKQTEITCWDAHTVRWQQPQPFAPHPATFTGKQLHRVRAAYRLADPQFTSGYRRFVAEYWDGSSFVGLFDGETGRLLYKLPVRMVHRSVPYQISPDDRTVAIGQHDGRLLVIELATGRVRSAFRHEGEFRSIAFSPDGRLLAAESWDAPMLVWDVRGELSPPDGPPDADALAAAWEELDSDDAREAFEAIRLLAAFPDGSLPFLRQHPAPDGWRAVRAVEAVEWMATPEAVKLLESWTRGAPDATLAVEARAALARLKPN
jgi:WD40 repeat protein